MENPHNPSNTNPHGYCKTITGLAWRQMMQEQTQVTDITELNFSACGIQKLYPGELEMFPNLEVLHLDNNRIYQVPKGFAVSHPSLQTLTLSGNKMQEVQEGAIIDCRELTALGVGNNNLCELRPDQVGAPYLQYLDTCLNRHLTGNKQKVWVRKFPHLKACCLLDFHYGAINGPHHYDTGETGSGYCEECGREY